MKICLAASESLVKTNREYYIQNSRYSLVSFYYIEKWQSALFNSELFLLDSGAFTFISNCKGDVDFDSYLDRYIAFIKENDIKYFFELDVDAIVGYDKVKQMRAKLERAVGRQCIPVWHRTRGLDEWKRLTKDYNYIAIGGFAIKDIKEREYRYITALLEIARKNGCKVHGLGFTSLKYLDKFHFYSVDSTTWLSGSRYGNIYVFKHNKMKQHPHPKGKRLKSGEYLAEMQLFNLREWIKYQHYASKYL